MTIDPYGLLGVGRDADLQTIKAAYRSCAKATHPDAGGTAAAFQDVEHAWRILRDPDKRAAYDRDGSVDDAPTLSFEQQVTVKIVALFDQYIQTGKAFESDFDIIRSMRDVAQRVVKEHTDLADAGEVLIGKLEKLRSRISADGERNILTPGIDAKLASVRQQVGAARAEVKLAEAAIAELEHYECVTEIVERSMFFTSFHDFSQSSTFGNFR